MNKTTEKPLISVKGGSQHVISIKKHYFLTDAHAIIYLAKKAQKNKHRNTDTSGIYLQPIAMLFVKCISVIENNFILFGLARTLNNIWQQILWKINQ